MHCIIKNTPTQRETFSLCSSSSRGSFQSFDEVYIYIELFFAIYYHEAASFHWKSFHFFGRLFDWKMIRTESADWSDYF